MELLSILFLHKAKPFFVTVDNEMSICIWPFLFFFLSKIRTRLNKSCEEKCLQEDIVDPRVPMKCAIVPSVCMCEKRE